MKRIFLSLFLFFSGSFFLIVNAQSQFSGWLAAFNTFKTAKKTSIHADVQWRSSDELQHTQTLLLRSGVNVHLNKHIILTGGYAFVHNRRLVNNVSGYAPEHRIWEQVIYNHKIKPVYVTHRLRLEQRFIAQTTVQNNELKNDGYSYANRVRYFIRNILPFQTQKTFTRGMFAALQDEVFLNLGNSNATNGKFFDQNRFYLAIGYRLNASFDLEAGYLNQYTSGKNGAFTNNHVVQLAGYIRI